MRELRYRLSVKLPRCRRPTVVHVDLAERDVEELVAIYRILGYEDKRIVVELITVEESVVDQAA